MTISNDKVVSMHYTLKNNQGEIIDSSVGGEPLGYLHGHGNIISGLENALTGKFVGDVLDVVVKPEEGYGVRDEDLMQTVERTIFGNVPDLQPGMQFQARSQEGTMMVRVIEIDGNDITVDGNHPLAGETLNFHVEIMNIRDASAEELADGRVL